MSTNWSVQRIATGTSNAPMVCQIKGIQEKKMKQGRGRQDKLAMLQQRRILVHTGIH